MIFCTYYIIICRFVVGTSIAKCFYSGVGCHAIIGGIYINLHVSIMYRPHTHITDEDH